MQPRDEYRWNFVRNLERLPELAAGKGSGAGEARATLAALRRGLGKGPGEAPEMFPYVVPRLPPMLRAEEEEPYYLVASLFASHPSTWHRGDQHYLQTNFGASIQRVRNAARSESIEARFVALLSCHRADLPEHLRHAVALCKAHEVRIDWLQLLTDISRWDEPRRSTQRQWARAFWAEEPAPENPAE